MAITYSLPSAPSVDYRSYPRKTISLEEAKSLADEAYHQNTYKLKLKDVCDNLMTMNVATTSQIRDLVKVTSRWFEEYQQGFWVAGYPVADVTQLVRLGYPIKRSEKYYILGRVAHAYIPQYEQRTPNPNFMRNEHSVAHSLLVNHVVLQVIKMASPKYHAWTWDGKHELPQYGRLDVRPDARVQIDRNNQALHCFIEHHRGRNADKRIADKIYTYETKHRNDAEPPLVFITYDNDTTHVAYKEAIKDYIEQHSHARCRYLTAPITDFLVDNNVEWTRINPVGQSSRTKFNLRTLLS